MTATSEVTTAADLVAALERHYTGGPGHRDADSHATYTELTHNRTGSRCDFIAVSLWESRGRLVAGHEIKASRADWIRELNKPTKAELWWQCCHTWWLVVPHESIVHEGELPDGWGLMVPTGKRRMKVITKPAVRAVTPPTWLTVALIKREHRAAIAAHQRGYDTGERAGRDAERQRADDAVLSHFQRTRLALLAAIETALGRPIQQYAWWGEHNQPLGPAQAAAAIQVARALQSAGDSTDLAFLINAAERVGQAAKDLQVAADTARREFTQLDRNPPPNLSAP